MADDDDRPAAIAIKKEIGQDGIPASPSDFEVEVSQFHNADHFTVDDDSRSTPVPEEVLRHQSTGASVAEQDAILGESGRTYHAYEAGKYFLPNDPTEQDRLDLQHATMAKLLGSLYKAPLSEAPRYVLDVATGTGIWANEFAETHPSSHVIGTDLSLIQAPNPNLRNCEFFRKDSETDWDFEGILFDFIHFRMTFTCFDDPKKVVQRAFDNLQPGGWVEYQESMFYPNILGGTAEGTALKEWCDRCNDGARILRGRDITKTPFLEEWLKEAGFVETQELRYVLPSNPWPTDPGMKEVGVWNLTNLMEGLRGIGWKMVQATGLKPPEIEQLIETVKMEITNTSNRFYFTFYVVYGQKPLAAKKEVYDQTLLDVHEEFEKKAVI